MNLDFDAADLAFQSEVREFFAEGIPDAWRIRVRSGLRLEPEDLIYYQRRLNDRGWGRRPGPRNMVAPAGRRRSNISSGARRHAPMLPRSSIKGWS